jgi:hypothetical protein
MSDLLGDNMGGAIKSLKNAISNAGTAIGSSFEAPFKKVFQGANLFIRGLTQLFTQGGFSGDVKDALDKHPLIKDFTTKVFIVVERIKHFFSELGDSFTTAFAPFKPLLDPLVETFKSLGKALGLTNDTADENAKTWDAFGDAGSSTGSVLGNMAGNVLPQLISLIDSVTQAVDFVKEAIKVLGPTLSGVWETFKGVFELIDGLFTGDWKKMWDGLIDIVVGASKAIVRLALGALAPIAMMMDTMGAAIGQDYGFGSSVASMQAAVNSGAIERGAGVLKDMVPASAPAVAAMPDAATQKAAQDVLRQMGLGFLGDLKDRTDKDLNITTHVHLDGEKIATAMGKAKRAGDARSYTPVPAAGGAF